MEELEEVLKDMRFYLCELVSRERELVYAKEQFLRVISILDTQFILMLDK